MSISPSTRAVLEHLSASANDLLRDLDAMETPVEVEAGECPPRAAPKVRGYLMILMKGWSEDDAITALKGANLLTGINEGVSDTDLGQAKEALGAKAFAVTKDAFYAAERLRSDAGMPF